jgi:hypothetical protein
MNIVIVGGGKAAVIILERFQYFKEHKIIGISDIKDTAPGIIRAKEFGIPTTDDFEKIIKNNHVDLVIEVTGNEKVQEKVRGLLNNHQQMMPSSGAKLMCDLIDAQNLHSTELANSISGKFSELTKNIENAIQGIDDSFKQIEKMLMESQMININASVQAARAGDAGKPFAVVVNRLGDLVKQISETLNAISLASEETHGIISELHKLEIGLKESFKG